MCFGSRRVHRLVWSKDQYAIHLQIPFKNLCPKAHKTIQALFIHSTHLLHVHYLSVTFQGAEEAILNKGRSCPHRAHIKQIRRCIILQIIIKSLKKKESRKGDRSLLTRWYLSILVRKSCRHPGNEHSGQQESEGQVPEAQAYVWETARVVSGAEWPREIRLEMECRARSGFLGQGKDLCFTLSNSENHWRVQTGESHNLTYIWKGSVWRL